MPVDRGAIDAQLREIGEGDRWWEQREFRSLPHILHSEERIRGIVSGKLLGRRRPRVKPAARWLFVATNQRLLCLKQQRLARKQVDIAPGQIKRVRQTSRIRGYDIIIETAQGRYRLRIPKADAFRFAAALAPLIPEPPVPMLNPDLAPWLRIPGVAAVAALPGISGIISRATALAPPPAQAAYNQLERLEANVERLQTDVDRLQQQVAFLEDLLEKRAEEAVLSRSRVD